MALESFELFVKDYENISAQNRLRLSFFLDLSREFQSLGIPVLPLKGMDLLLRAYPSLGMRPMADIDLLIQKKDIRKIMAFFEKKGFKRKPDEGLTYLSPDGSINLDIIWDFWYFDRPEDIQTVWQNAANELLHPEDDLIYQVAYTIAHRGMLSEMFVRDLNFFLEKESTLIDWPRLAQKIKRLKLRVAFFHGFSYALEKEALSIPKDFLVALQPSSLNERALASLFKRLVTEAPQPKISYFFTWLGYPGFRGKLQLLREKILPTPLELEIRRGITSPAGYIAYLFLHPIFILIRGLGFALKSLCGF